MDWIKVEDRFPEIGKAVLMLVTCCDYSNIEEGEYLGNDNWVNCWCSKHNKNLYPVTHWMPKPKPPKE